MAKKDETWSFTDDELDFLINALSVVSGLDVGVDDDEIAGHLQQCDSLSKRFIAMKQCVKPDGSVCGVCGDGGTTQHPLDWVCSVCGNVTHEECGYDTEPSGGWDRDDDENYWVCWTCLK